MTINNIISKLIYKIPYYDDAEKKASKRKIKEFLAKNDYDESFIESVNDDFCKGFGCAKKFIENMVINEDNKNKTLKEFYVLKNDKEVKFFAMDSVSGGYPYVTEDLTDAYKFNNLDKFEEFKNSDYYKSFESGLKDCKLVKITINIEE